MPPTPHPDHAIRAVPCAVLTVSDTRTSETDKNGQLSQTKLTTEGHRVVAYQIFQDEPVQVRKTVQAWLTQGESEAVLINGGTGIALRDTIYEAIASLLTKTLPGLGELFRMLSYGETGSRAMASRAIAGACNNILIFCMPGSSKAVALVLDKLILPELNHLTTQLKG